MIFVNDLVSTIGYTKNRLDHFVFSLWDSDNDDWIIIKHASADDYVFLCDRPVEEWIISEFSDNKIDIFIKMEEGDHLRFHNDGIL